MGFSDWLTIIFSTLGVFAGAGISWIFFRTQLLADFRSLREKIAEINVAIQHIDVDRSVLLAVSPILEKVHADIRELKTKIDVIDEIDNSKEIASIKVTVEKLDGNLNAAVSEILRNVKDQQYELAERIQNTFRSQAETATNVVRDVFAAEVSRFVKNVDDKEKLLKSLVASFMDGMRVMGEYQRLNIEKETSSSIDNIERKISKSIEEVFEEVVELKEKVLALPSS